MSDKPLQIELAYYEANRRRFLEIAPVKYVLIRGEGDFGFFDTAENAYKAGADVFGLEPFLIKQVLPEDEIIDVPAYTLGLIHASL